MGRERAGARRAPGADAAAVGVVVSLHAAGSGLPKERAPALTLRAGHGALGDRHAGRDPDRAVLVVGAAAYEAIAAAGIEVAYGTLGENLVIAGTTPEALAPGTRLRAGEVELRLGAPCTVCSHLATIHPRLPKVAYGRRGVYARVVRGGVVTEGAPVRARPADRPAAEP